VLNFKTATTKEIFLHHLKEWPVDFGLIADEDRTSFIDFACNNHMLQFICHKEYRGILGRYDVLKDFEFKIPRDDGYHSQHLQLRKNDTIEFSELLPLSGYRKKYRDNDIELHEIYQYVTDEERAEIYEM
jgi:hypothetical protein